MRVFFNFPGVEKPGSIRFFDSKGEIMDKSEFLIGIDYHEADFEGGLGIHETGNRGTKHGLNMCAIFEKKTSLNYWV